MKRAKGWLFIAPAFLHLLVFALIPIGYAFYVSLFKLQLLQSKAEFVGAGNYSFSLHEPMFWNAMWNSFRFALVSVPLGMAIALAVALLVSQKLRGMTIFRTIFYIPAISSVVAIAMLWIYVYLPNTGMINSFLGLIRIKNDTDYLQNVSYAMWALVFMSAWTGLGPRMVLFLAGLLGIPQTLYEAAEIDGASRVRTFFSITLPMLAPTTFFVLVTSTIGALQMFTPVYMMTKGGPQNSTDVIGYHIYNEAWTNFHVGLSAAKSFILLAVILVISIGQFRLMRGQLQGYAVA